MDQRELRRGEGPIACVLVPTRELALQIYTEVRRYCRVYNIEVCREQIFYLTVDNTMFYFYPSLLILMSSSGGVRVRRRE